MNAVNATLKSTVRAFHDANRREASTSFLLGHAMELFAHPQRRESSSGLHEAKIGSSNARNFLAQAIGLHARADSQQVMLANTVATLVKQSGGDFSPEVQKALGVHLNAIRGIVFELDNLPQFSAVTYGDLTVSRTVYFDTRRGVKPHESIDLELKVPGRDKPLMLSVYVRSNNKSRQVQARDFCYSGKVFADHEEVKILVEAVLKLARDKGVVSLESDTQCCLFRPEGNIDALRAEVAIKLDANTAEFLSMICNGKFRAAGPSYIHVDPQGTLFSEIVTDEDERFSLDYPDRNDWAFGSPA